MQKYTFGKMTKLTHILKMWIKTTLRYNFSPSDGKNPKVWQHMEGVKLWRRPLCTLLVGSSRITRSFTLRCDPIQKIYFPVTQVKCARPGTHAQRGLGTQCLPVGRLQNGHGESSQWEGHCLACGGTKSWMCDLHMKNQAGVGECGLCCISCNI